jgi:hypothetical protein
MLAFLIRFVVPLILDQEGGGQIWPSIAIESDTDGSGWFCQQLEPALRLVLPPCVWFLPNWNQEPEMIEQLLRTPLIWNCLAITLDHLQSLWLPVSEWLNQTESLSSTGRLLHATVFDMQFVITLRQVCL